ncbi:MAG: hypothetical protein HYY30_08950 [Chloroflexi bacterium]|nr:hypothetical protein [Chloroflexota bacterium]
MKLAIFPIVGLLAAVLLVLGAFAVVQGQPVPAPQDQMQPDTGMTLPGLEGIPPDQLFSHFTGAQINLIDKDNNAMTINVIPGTVSSIANDNVVITPNGRTTTERYNITTNTVIHAFPARGSLQAIASGDQVVILTQGDSMDAIMIAKKNMMGRMGFSHPMFR